MYIFQMDFFFKLLVHLHIDVYSVKIKYKKKHILI